MSSFYMFTSSLLLCTLWKSLKFALQNNYLVWWSKKFAFVYFVLGILVFSLKITVLISVLLKMHVWSNFITFSLSYTFKKQNNCFKNILLFYERGTFRNLIIFFILAETSLLLYNVLVLEIFCVDSLSGHTPICECRVVFPVCSHRAGARFPDGLSLPACRSLPCPRFGLPWQVTCHS